jgi:ribonuclease T1
MDVDALEKSPPPATVTTAWTRRAVAVCLLVMALIVGPAIIAPAYTSQAEATVYSSCTISGCSAARTARSGWSGKGFPTSRGWYTWSSQYNFAGGQFYNREGQLPSGATYHEYDVYPRAQGAARDAHRIVVNRSTGVTWYSPNHYTDFYRL